MTNPKNPGVHSGALPPSFGAPAPMLQSQTLGRSSEEYAPIKSLICLLRSAGEEMPLEPDI